MNQSARGRSGESDPHDDSLLRIVWRQKGVIVLCTILSLLLAFGYLAVAPKVYTAAGRIQVQRAIPLTDRQGAITSDNNAETFIFQEAELIKSSPVLLTAMGGPGMDELQYFASAKSPSALLKRELDVEVGKKDAFITVSLSSRDHDEAVKIVENVIESYKAFKSKQRRDTASGVLTLLEKDKEKTDAQLATKLDDLLKFKQANNTLSFDGDKTNYIITRTNSLSEELTKAHIETINLKTAFDSAMRGIAGDEQAVKALDKAGGVILSSTDEETLRAEMFAKNQELAERRRIYLPDHPIIKTLESRIKQLNVSYVSSAKLRWQAAQEREKELQRSFDEQQKLAMDMSSKAAEYDRLLKESQSLQKHSDDLDSRVKDVTLTLDAGAMTVTEIDPVSWEDQPVKPQRPQTMMIAGCLGLLLGSLLAVAREWMDPRLRSESEVKTAMGVPVLGAIPHLAGATAPEAIGWAVHLDPTSEAAEAYRAVRTSLQFGVADGESRTIVITSPSARDGKSTLSSNLAIALAKGGKTVLMIDADFRSPSQHQIFGVNNEVGFSNVLEAGVLVDRAIRRTTVEGLHVMPAGPSVMNPSELLNSSSLSEILDELAKTYDHIVIDTPPVLRVDDARIVAASSDVTVLVLRADKSNRKYAEDSRDRLVAVGARFLGIVLNDISGSGGNGFGGGFGSGGFGSGGFGSGGFGGSGAGGSSGAAARRAAAGRSREVEQQTSADDVSHHALVRPITGAGRMM